MPVFGYKPSNLSPNDPNILMKLLDEYGRLQKTLDYLLNGGLDSKNAREFGGFKVNNDSLMHSSGIVGMSSAGTAATSVRFWAGASDPTLAPFRVTQGGVMTAVGATIKTSDTYPRVELNGQTGVLTIYYSDTQYVQLIPDSSGQPEIYFKNGSVSGSLGPTSSAIDLSTSAGSGDINISSGGALNLFAQSNINVTNWSQFYSTGAGKTLQTELNAKANGSGLNGSVFVSSTSGGPADTLITFTNGVRTI